LKIRKNLLLQIQAIWLLKPEAMVAIVGLPWATDARKALRVALTLHHYVILVLGARSP
jgi:hypothetical protein